MRQGGKTMPDDTKKVFRKQGTCSRTLFYLVNRAFGRNRELEGRAVDPLAGGIVQKGYQCGMLWGASLAAGTEAYERFGKGERAVGAAIGTSQDIVKSFTDCAGCADCRDFTGTDFSKPLQMARYVLFRTRRCFNLAEDWVPDAVDTVRKGLSAAESTLEKAGVDKTVKKGGISCATETARKMGAGDEEAVMVAGFAGGIGLGGGGCGAAAAAVWIKSLEWCRKNPGKSGFGNPAAKQTVKAFEEAAGARYTCREITGRTFANAEEHAEFITNGGCAELIKALAES